jgi:hypothetical protein
MLSNHRIVKNVIVHNINENVIMKIIVLFIFVQDVETIRGIKPSKYYGDEYE